MLKCYFFTQLVPRIRTVTFETEPQHDYLYIYDGMNASSKLITSMSGWIYTPFNSLFASQRYMYIRFTTDESVTMKGFSLMYDSIGKISYLVQCNFIVL